MTQDLRSTQQYTLFEEFFNKYTAILRKSDLELTNWNTGAEGDEEKNFLLSCTEEEFNNYCKQQFN
jgi:succinate dehydrogenase flavin-adding protein (antitoxin of CptAB toxin-antitoxin module)